MVKWRVGVGIGLLVLVTLIIVAVQAFTGGGSDAPTVTVKGFLGGEKAGLLRDPDVQKILKDKYHLAIDFTTAGSLELVQRDTTGEDFLWPSNEVALELYKENHGGTANSTTIFNSPIVLYSWDIVTDALIAQGIVQQTDGTYYVTDMPKLIAMINGATEWKDIGLPQLFGRVSVISTDPTKSNSGNMFAGLLANMLAGGKVADETSIETVLPQIKAYFNSLGYLEQGSGDLFNRFIRTGVGDKPIIVGYESQLIELGASANESDRAEILKRLRIIYPKPTVWSSHPLIALTKNGEELTTALRDPELQKIAWERHGFRSGLFGVQSDPASLNLPGVPATIESVIPLPRPRVMQRLIDVLSQ